MRVKTYRRGALVALLVAAAPLVAASAVNAEQPSSGAAFHYPGSRPLQLTVGQGRLLYLAGPAATVFVANPAVANVQAPVPNRIFVFGKAPGTTNIFALASDGTQLQSVTVTVVADAREIQQQLSSTPDLGQANVSVTPSGIALRGETLTPQAAEALSRAANASVTGNQKIENDVTVNSSAQVMLAVRVAEVERTVTKDLGINWNTVFSVGNAFKFGLVTGRSAFSGFPGCIGCSVSGSTSVSSSTGTSTSFTPQTFTSSSIGDGSAIASFGTPGINGSSVIDALATEGVISVLAEPNLTTLSGQPASFLAGGEFPYPGSVSQSGTVGISFAQYGVALDFVPTVYSDNHINLHVRPEVSQLDYAKGITIDGSAIPGLDVRRADTDVELGSGQSFAIGGLLQNNLSNTVNRYPGLGDLPVLGALFRSTNYQRDETELVIFVTPYIVSPIESTTSLHMPTDGLTPPSDLERIFYGYTAARPKAATLNESPGFTAPHLEGSAGFDME